MKAKELYRHRQVYYFDALDRLFEGKETPEYVHYRFKKLKLIRTKK